MPPQAEKKTCHLNGRSGGEALPYLGVLQPLANCVLQISHRAMPCRLLLFYQVLYKQTLPAEERLYTSAGPTILERGCVHTHTIPPLKSSCDHGCAHAIANRQHRTFLGGQMPNEASAFFHALLCAVDGLFFWIGFHQGVHV